MASLTPESTVKVQDSLLDDYTDEWSDILRQLLLFFKCETRIQVKTCSFYEGDILAKYRIGIILPDKLKLSMRMPYGEARSATAAYQIAVVEAITDIRESKGKELKGTIHTLLPYGGDDMDLDYHKFVKAKTRDAAKYLERCIHLLDMYATTHRALAFEIETQLEDFTGTNKMVEFKQKSNTGVGKLKSPYNPTAYTDYDINRDEYTMRIPKPEPNDSYAGQTSTGYFAHAGDSELPDYKLPEPTGWEDDKEPYAGTISDPIQFSSDGSAHSMESASPYRSYPCTPEYPVVTKEMLHPFGMNTSRYEGNVEPEEEYDSAAAAYKYLDSYFTMTNLTLEPSSDTDYVPERKVELPGILRRTSRYSGWTPGKYYEADE